MRKLRNQTGHTERQAPRDEKQHRVEINQKNTEIMKNKKN